MGGKMSKYKEILEYVEKEIKQLSWELDRGMISGDTTEAMSKQMAFYMKNLVSNIVKKKKQK